LHKRSTFESYAAPLGLGATRSAIGTAESLSGLYDLATPGKGTNRFGQAFQRGGEQVDATVQDKDYSKVGYKAGQAATDVATFMAAGTPLTKSVAKGGEILSKAPGIPRALNYVDDVAQNGTRVTSAIAKGAKYLARPDVASNIISDTALSSGLRSNRGQDISVASVGTDAAISGAMGAGVGLTGKVIKSGVIEPTTKLLRNANIIPPTRLGAQQLADITDFHSQARSGGIMDDGLYQRAVQALDSVGVDYRNPKQVDDLLGSHRTFDTRNAEFAQNKLNPAFAQSGSAPAGAFDPLDVSGKVKKTDPLESLKQEATPKTVPNIPRNTQVLDAFNTSANQKKIARVDDTDFELGSFGKNQSGRKQASPDRFDAKELKDTLSNKKAVYNASNDPKSYRSGNKAWVSEMPNGEKRVIYTRPNKNGAEEIINWHKVDETKNPNYLSTLESYGTPAQNRTGSFGLERRAGSVPQELTDTIPKTGRNVNDLSTTRPEIPKEYSPDLPTQAVDQQSPQVDLPKQTKSKAPLAQDQPKVQSESPLTPAASPRRATSQASENPRRTPLQNQSGEKSSRSPQRISSADKLQQKTAVVKDTMRALDGQERTSYGLRDSFDKSDNVPKDLKEALGAFGNERTVRSNKELWQSAQKRVVDDPADAMKFFKENNSDDAVATGYALINRHMKSGNVKAAGELSIDMAERALESGRTTQAYALMKRLTPEGAMSYVEKKVQRFIKDNPKMAGKVNWNDGLRKQLYDMADNLNKMPDGRDRNLAIGKMQQTIDNIFPSSVADKAVTVWKAGLLTSLRTHERNILGNTINLGAEQASLVPGSLADRIMSLRTGKRTLVATPGKKMAGGAKYGTQIAKDQIKTGIDVTNSNLKYNINHVTWGDSKVEKALKTYTETVFRPLGAEDKVFKEASRSNSFYNQAVAQAKTRKLKGQDFTDFVSDKTKNPTAKMMELADDDASRATFSQDNFLGDIIKNAKGAVRKSNKPGAKAASAFLDVLMPFTQVPSGVASQLYAYSPAKLIKSSYDIGKVLVTGDEALQRRAAQGFGRSVVGTSVLGAGAYLATQGLMTGDPKDAAQKAQWEAQGIKANSVKVGNRWYGVQSIAPQLILALAGGQMVADKENGDDPYTKMAANIGNNFTEQTFLKGMSSFIDAIKEPERNLDFYVQSQATSVVPNIIKDLTKAVDPNERQTNDVWDKFKGSLPGVSQSLPERKDSYGQTIKNSGALEMVDLFNSSKQKDSPEAKYIDKLRTSTGEKIHVPSKAPRSVDINGETKKLNSEEQSNYQGYIGDRSKESVNVLTNSDQFKSRFEALDDNEKVKLLDDLFQDVNSAAKIKLFGNTSKNKTSEAVQSIIDDNLLKAIELKLGAKEKSTAKTMGKTPAKGTAKTAKKSSGKRTAGKKSKYDYTKDLFGSTVTSSAVSKSLRQILESYMKA
jgi:hypothetical protein